MHCSGKGLLPFTSKVETAENWALLMTDWPAGRVPPESHSSSSGEAVFDLFGLSLSSFTSPARVFPSILGGSLGPVPADRQSLRARGGGGRVCSLRSGIGRAFPTLSRLETVPESQELPGLESASAGWKSRPGSPAPPRLPPLFSRSGKMAHT